MIGGVTARQLQSGFDLSLSGLNGVGIGQGPGAPFNGFLFEFPGAALCDRRNPPAGAEISRFEMLCYDGGQTGNTVYDF